MQRVTRPRGGVNQWLRWLPLSFHRNLDYIIKRFIADTLFPLQVGGKTIAPFPSKGSGNIGLSSILEPDPKQIAKMACDTFERYVFILF